MTRNELPDFSGLMRLENPDVGTGVTMSHSYTLEDVASLHADTIRALPQTDAPLHVIGMSMGGMIVGLLATTYRHMLPRSCKFRLLVTSPNSHDVPAIPDFVLKNWKNVRGGNYSDFARLLKPFFSPEFRESSPGVVETYIRYRTNGENKQTATGFFRQVEASQQFDGDAVFSNLDPSEAEFISASADGIFDDKHHVALTKSNRDVPHRIVSGLGHMVNLERPQLFDPREEG